jgi:hypothetical protein
MTNLSIPEPPPIPNDNPSIHDLVVEDLKKDTYIVLTKDILDRKAFGLKKYGVPLQQGNSRNPLRDAFQEVLDAICYIKQEAMQSNSLESKTLYFKLIDIAEDLKDLIENKPEQGTNISVLGDK